LTLRSAWFPSVFLHFFLWFLDILSQLFGLSGRACPLVLAATLAPPPPPPPPPPSPPPKPPPHIPLPLPLSIFDFRLRWSQCFRCLLDILAKIPGDLLGIPFPLPPPKPPQNLPFSASYSAPQEVSPSARPCVVAPGGTAAASKSLQSLRRPQARACLRHCVSQAP